MPLSLVCFFRSSVACEKQIQRLPTTAAVPDDETAVANVETLPPFTQGPGTANSEIQTVSYYSIYVEMYQSPVLPAVIVR